jgi:hypothetical protein
MRRLHGAGVLPVIVILLLLATAPAVAADQPDRPFKAHMGGQATFVPESTDPITLEPCQHFGALATKSFATGTAAHLGRVAMSAEHCTPLADEAIAGMMVLVAANGDELMLRYDGPTTLELAEHSVLAIYDYSIVDGNGRFDGAEGTGWLRVELTFETFDDPVWPGSFSLGGSIHY